MKITSCYASTHTGWKMVFTVTHFHFVVSQSKVGHYVNTLSIILPVTPLNLNFLFCFDQSSPLTAKLMADFTKRNKKMWGQWTRCYKLVFKKASSDQYHLCQNWYHFNVKVEQYQGWCFQGWQQLNANMTAVVDINLISLAIKVGNI